MLINLKTFVLKTYLLSRKAWRFAITGGHAVVKNRINVVQKTLAKGNQVLEDRIFMASSYRVTTPLRQDILAVTTGQNLSLLANSGLNIVVSDASDQVFTEKNESFFKACPGLKLDYKVEKKTMPQAYYDMLTTAKQKYCTVIYDDFPTFNLSPEFLQSSCDFLEDFSGLVDIIFIEAVDYEVSDERRTVTFPMQTHTWKLRNEKPLGVVRYGDYSFAIFDNFYYGFSFLSFIAPCRDYARRLRWYMEHISVKSPQIIEKAAMWFRGPVYNYIALPWETFIQDIDIEHTDTSLRGHGPKQESLYLGLKKHYTIKIK